MLTKLTYYPIFGKPLIMYLGILTLLLFLFTVLIAVLNKKGITWIPFKWHPRIAITAIILAIIHGLLSVLSYF